jgi:hypothetical protein
MGKSEETTMSADVKTVTENTEPPKDKCCTLPPQDNPPKG